MRFNLPIAMLALLAMVLPALPAQADPIDQTGQPVSEAPAAPSVATQPKSDMKVCKGVTYTGSRLPAKKVCKTKEQWAAMEEEIQADMRRQKRSSASRGSSVD